MNLIEHKLISNKTDKESKIKIIFEKNLRETTLIKTLNHGINTNLLNSIDNCQKNTSEISNTKSKFI
jgi:hypothetical protein